MQRKRAQSVCFCYKEKSSRETLTHNTFFSKSLSPKTMEQSNDEKLESILKTALSRFESTLIKNSITNIHADYFTTSNELKTSSISNVSNEEIVSLQEICSLTTVECKEKIISCIDVNISSGAIAIGVMTHRLLNERVLKPRQRIVSSYILVWTALEGSSSPLKLLCPADCSVCKFHPEIKDYIVAGCVDGRVCLFDLNSKISHNEINPTFTSAHQKNHFRMVTDIFWLPSHSQISTHGMTDNDYLSDQTNQFVTVGGGDGSGLLFWDVRFQNMYKGKRKYKPDCDDKAWRPFFQIKPKRLHGTGDISIQRCMYFPYGYINTKILCASESGDIMCINWSPDSDAEDESSFLSNQFVQWMVEDKFSTSFCCEVFCPSPFFPTHILYATPWNFQVWNTTTMSICLSPIIMRLQSTSRITCGCWSPSRPSLLYIGKNDGTIDVWDFSQSSYSPSLVISVKKIITSMKILRNFESDGYFLIVGDNTGSVNVFLLPESLTIPLAKEIEMMEEFLKRETESHDNIPKSTSYMWDDIGLEIEKESLEENRCLSDEQEIFYDDFCGKMSDKVSQS